MFEFTDIIGQQKKNTSENKFVVWIFFFCSFYDLVPTHCGAVSTFGPVRGLIVVFRISCVTLCSGSLSGKRNLAALFFFGLRLVYCLNLLGLPLGAIDRLCSVIKALPGYLLYYFCIWGKGWGYAVWSFLGISLFTF